MRACCYVAMAISGCVATETNRIKMAATINTKTPDELKSADNEAFFKLRGVNCFQGFEGKRAAISFTGGKDCHLALQRCRDAGLKVVCGVMFAPPNKKFQAHRMEWQQTQGKAMNIPIVQCELQLATPPDYKASYAAAIRKLQEEHDIQVLVTGDIDFVGSSSTNFMQQVCTEHDCNGVQVLLPLWQQSRKELLHEMIFTRHFDIRMSCVKTPHFDETWIGRRLDKQALVELEPKVKDGLDLTGENGEYHTMVVGGPMYQDNSLRFVDVKPFELLSQAGQKDGERWWVISETTKLVPS